MRNKSATIYEPSRMAEDKPVAKRTELLMGMPIKVAVTDPSARASALEKVFDYFRYVDEKFSTYKDNSEISKINRGEIPEDNCSGDMKTVLRLSEETRILTGGYFDIRNRKGEYDPSGLVKGWAIYNASRILKKEGYGNFYIDAGGDIEAAGKNMFGETWRIGIRNPFEPEKIVKILRIKNKGVATSGTYIRGQHIYNPKQMDAPIDEIVSLTVIGPNVYEADRFATAAFAMGKRGIAFIEKLDGFEGYLIDAGGIATMTSGFDAYAGAGAW